MGRPSMKGKMKNTAKWLFFAITTAIILFTVGCPSQQTQSNAGVKLPESKVDRALMEKATVFGTKVCRGWDNERFDLITREESAPGFFESLSPEKQKSLFQNQIFPAYGAFKQLFYKETYVVGNNFVFRFMGAYEKDAPEVRVVLTSTGLVTGFWIRPWTEDLE